MGKRMQHIWICATLALALSSCASPLETYSPGTYTGEAEGYHSKIVVEVTTSAYAIKKIDIVEEQETPVLGEIVFEEVPKAIIKSNSTEVDVVAGATYTSNRLIRAVENALKEAEISQSDTSGE